MLGVWLLEVLHAMSLVAKHSKLYRSKNLLATLSLGLKNLASNSGSIQRRGKEEDPPWT